MCVCVCVCVRLWIFRSPIAANKTNGINVIYKVMFYVKVVSRDLCFLYKNLRTTVTAKGRWKFETILIGSLPDCLYKNAILIQTCLFTDGKLICTLA